jgi:hypothetical protein
LHGRRSRVGFTTGGASHEAIFGWDTSLRLSQVRVGPPPTILAMTTINGIEVPGGQISRLTAELHRQAVEGPHRSISGGVADRLSNAGAISLSGEEALATIEAIGAAGIDIDDALLARLRKSVGGIEE